MPQDQTLSAVSPALNELRSGTQTLHVALEKRLPFFCDTLDLERYKRLLSAYYGFYHELEDRLQHSPLMTSGFDLHARLKTPALHRDLQALGVNTQSLALCDTLPVLSSPASVLGVLYVLEGATLGGNVLRKQMSERLGLDAHNGCAFLYVYGEATGRQWKAFMDFLGSVPLDAQARGEAVQAACSTFSCFEQWLERQEVLL
ncbi:biliverdin-producing heme oxygenase [Pseudomonas sp. ML2-2023-3]|uniref:biliverdin-producing heme oxygenase n=1 Tax=Pseudomonas sp. ML2-2023-3 TaxID=3122375 RepID=UPI0030CDFFEE